MSTSAPISIATSGLVFHYDIDNIKSYAGPAASNIASAISTTTSTSTGFSFVGGTETVYIPGLNASVVSAYDDVQNNYSLSNWCCPAPISYGDVAASGSTTYTYSILYRSGNGYTSGNYMYRYEFNGGTYITEAGVFDDAKRVDMGNGWYWAYNTFTTNASTNRLTLSLFYYYYSSVSNRVHVAKVMVMKGDYTNLHPRYWPGLSETRSATSSVLDFSSNNTLTTSNLTYASDGKFSFNGTNSLITVPFNASLFTFNSEQTIILWMKNQSSSGARRNPYNQAYGGGGTITHEYDTNFNYFWGQGGGDNNPYQGFTSGFSVVVGETAMVCLTRNASTVSYYKNGVFSNSTSNPYGSAVVTGTNNITIGQGYAGNFSGGIYTVQLYNRCLSASEVLQNYNSAKSRFGL